MIDKLAAFVLGASIKRAPETKVVVVKEVQRIYVPQVRTVYVEAPAPPPTGDAYTFTHTPERVIDPGYLMSVRISPLPPSCNLLVVGWAVDQASLNQVFGPDYIDCFFTLDPQVVGAVIHTYQAHAVSNVDGSFVASSPIYVAEAEVPDA